MNISLISIISYSFKNKIKKLSGLHVENKEKFYEIYGYTKNEKNCILANIIMTAIFINKEKSL